jgi:DnaK suppressor protein
MAPTSTAAKKVAKAPKAARPEVEPAAVVKARKVAGASSSNTKKGAAAPAAAKAGSPVPKPVRKSVGTKAVANQKEPRSPGSAAAKAVKVTSAKRAKSTPATNPASGNRANGAKGRAQTPANKTSATKASATKGSLAGADGATSASARARVPALAKRSPAEDGRKAPPRRKGPLDKFLLGQLAILEEERGTYTRQAVSLRAEADQLVAEREPGDVQFDEESGEGDTLAVERERDLALSAQAAAAVEDIDLAIAKIHDGTYGVCEQCYSNIPKERLRALPYAALCVQCKSAGFSRR